RKIESEAKTVVDPEGLGNKKSAVTKHEKKIGKDGDSAETLVKNHAKGTRESVTIKEGTSKNWTNDGTTTTKSEEKVVDPKGLGNKKSEKVAEKTVTDGAGGKERTVTREVDGDTVSEKTDVVR